MQVVNTSINQRINHIACKSKAQDRLLRINARQFPCCV
uniref:Uncharacterized protein n=1 Tax=Vibrio cholerae serotype O1 biovar El Tor TaxID=686 RepID=A0A2Z4TJQ5_VIBCE|nr:hypothetical protein orf00220 [Vibrio cholerae O1 biovar El Tor]